MNSKIVEDLVLLLSSLLLKDIWFEYKNIEILSILTCFLTIINHTKIANNIIIKLREGKKSFRVDKMI